MRASVRVRPCNRTLRCNRITAVAAATFTGLDSLRQIDLAENMITTIETGTFDGLELTYLHLGSNAIESIPAAILPLFGVWYPKRFGFVVHMQKNLLQCYQKDVDFMNMKERETHQVGYYTPAVAPTMPAYYGWGCYCSHMHQAWQPDMVARLSNGTIQCRQEASEAAQVEAILIRATALLARVNAVQSAVTLDLISFTERTSAILNLVENMKKRIDLTPNDGKQHSLTPLPYPRHTESTVVLI